MCVVLLMSTLLTSWVGAVSGDDSKIVGGFYVKEKQIPWIVSIQTVKEGHICGGSLFTPIFVLTACHCLSPVSERQNEPSLPDDVRPYRFVAGTLNHMKTNHGQRRYAQKFHIHPKCREITTLVYDFGVARMKMPFDINAIVKPMKILSMDPKVFQARLDHMIADDNSVCLVAGWGDTTRGMAEEPKASKFLKAVRMYAVSSSYCQSVYNRRNSKFKKFDFKKHYNLCAVSKYKNESDCVGDSGGPYYCNGFVVALVSYGYECGTEMPAVYVALTPFLNWFKYDVLRYYTQTKRRVPSAGRSIKSGTTNVLNSNLMRICVLVVALGVLVTLYPQ